MPNEKISNLTDGGLLQPGDEIPVARASETLRVGGDNFVSVIYRQAPVTAENTTNQVTIASANVPGGTIGADRMLEWKLRGLVKSSQTVGTVAGLGLVITYGGVTAYEAGRSITSAMSASAPFYLTAALMGGGNTSRQVFSGEFIFNLAANVTAGIGGITTDEINGIGVIANVSVAVDSSASQPFIVAVQFGTAATSTGLVSFGGPLTRY